MSNKYDVRRFDVVYIPKEDKLKKLTKEELEKYK